MDATRCAVHGTPTLSLAASNHPPAKLEMGTVIVGRYRVESLLSQGGMGALLLASELASGDRVVIKVLRGHRVTDPGNVRRFYQEARVASALDHPNIVRIFEFGVDEPTRAPFLAMEYVAGRTLKQIIQQEGPLNEARIGRLFQQIGLALVEAHQKNVLHRDLKPSNIMVTRVDDHEQVKVLDFGLAKIMEDTETAPLTVPGKTVGTPAFMAPEQVTQRAQDFRTDLYGLGCVLHATLTGHPPFSGEDLIEVMRRQVREAPPGVPELLSDGRPPSELLIELHQRLLEKQKNDRPGSTEEVVELFRRLAGGSRFSGIAEAGTVVETIEVTSTDADGLELARVPGLGLPAPSTSLGRIPSSDTVLSQTYGAADPFSVHPATLDPSRDELETPVATLAMTEAFIESTSSDDQSPLAQTGRLGLSSGTQSALSNESQTGLFEPSLPSRVVARRDLEVATNEIPQNTEVGTNSQSDRFGLTPSVGTVQQTGLVETHPERPRPQIEPVEDSEDVWTALLPSSLDGNEVIDGLTPALLESAPPLESAKKVESTEPEIPALPTLDPASLRVAPDRASAERPSPEPARSAGDQLRARPSINAKGSGRPPPPAKFAKAVIASLALATLFVVVTIFYTAQQMRQRVDPPPPPPPTVAEPVEPAPAQPRIVPRAEVARSPSRVEVQSVPTRAEVYLDGQLLGMTPLPLEVAGGAIAPRLILKKKGYRDEDVLLGADAPSPLVVRLHRDH